MKETLSLVLAAIVFVSSTPVKDCGSKGAKLLNVSVTGCPTSPCVLHRGSDIDITIQFTSLEKAEQVTAEVHGVIGGIPIPFPLPHSNACQDCGLQCPLKLSTTYSYHTTIPVLSSYPKIHLMVKWELIDEKNKDLVCILIPAVIS